MEQLTRQVRRAQRRLGAERFLSVLGWCCCVTLLMAAVLIAVDKFWPTGVDAWIWGVGALGLGLVAAAVWAVVRGRGPIDAAIEIDRRFGLKERVSSAMAMSDDQRKTPAGQAVVDDAVGRVSRVDLGEHFTIPPGRHILLPLIPGALALLLALLPSPVRDEQAQAAADPQVAEQVQKSSEALRKRLLEQQERAEQQGLKDAGDLFKRLVEEAKDLAHRAEDRKQALVKLNDLAREIQKRREELGGAERIQQQLDQLKNVQQGPADKFLRAVQEGDFKQAIDELRKLKEKLAEETLTEQERDQLANQLNEMEEKLKKLSQAHRRAEQDLQQRIDQARREGRSEEADRLEEQRNKLAEQRPQMNQLRDLASKLGQCAQCVQGGQLQDAANMLDQLQADVSDLREQLEEMEMLDEALDQLAQCRNRMNCSHCGGDGCEACQGNRPGPALGGGQGDGGLGLGMGRGQGDRPEEKNQVDFIKTQASVKTGPGAASVVGQAEGPNYKGDAQQEMQAQYEAARSRPADPVTVQRLPRPYRAHALEYLKRFSEGE